MLRGHAQPAAAIQVIFYLLQCTCRCFAVYTQHIAAGIPYIHGSVGRRLLHDPVAAGIVHIPDHGTRFGDARDLAIDRPGNADNTPIAVFYQVANRSIDAKLTAKRLAKIGYQYR